MERPMEKCNTDLVAGNERVGNVSIRGSIFQGDILSSLLFMKHNILSWGIGVSCSFYRFS